MRKKLEYHVIQHEKAKLFEKNGLEKARVKIQRNRDIPIM